MISTKTDKVIYFNKTAYRFSVFENVQAQNAI